MCVLAFVLCSDCCWQSVRLFSLFQQKPRLRSSRCPVGHYWLREEKICSFMRHPKYWMSCRAVQGFVLQRYVTEFELICRLPFFPCCLIASLWTIMQRICWEVSNKTGLCIGNLSLSLSLWGVVRWNSLWYLRSTPEKKITDSTVHFFINVVPVICIACLSVLL